MGARGRLRPRHLPVALALLAALGVGAAWRAATLEARRLLTVAQDHDRRGVSPRDLPGARLAALLAVEDPAFYEHRGVDLTTPGAGWTTLTQGLVKLHFPGPHRGLLGKPLQSARALALDRAVPKDLQLALLLNTAYFGHLDGAPVVGFPAAARRYYGRPLAELSDEEFVGLVAMLVGPDRFNPERHPAVHAERRRRIEALLAGRCTPRGWSDVYLEGCAE
jgi:membrane peptidoglycan carboxypeptidase